MVMTFSQAKVQGQQLVDSEDRVEANDPCAGQWKINGHKNCCGQIH